MELKRIGTVSNCNSNGGTIKFKTVDRGFANETFNVWF